MALPNPKSKTTNLHVRIREDLREKLQNRADREKRTLSAMVSVLLEELVEDNPKDYLPVKAKPSRLVRNGQKAVI